MSKSELGSLFLLFKKTITHQTMRKKRLNLNHFRCVLPWMFVPAQEKAGSVFSTLDVGLN